MRPRSPTSQRLHLAAFVRSGRWRGRRGASRRVDSPKARCGFAPAFGTWRAMPQPMSEGTQRTLTVRECRMNDALAELVAEHKIIARVLRTLEHWASSV